jgi:hypothetical protein
VSYLFDVPISVPAMSFDLLKMGQFLDWAAVVLPTILAIGAAIMTTLPLKSTASRNYWRFGLIAFGLVISVVTWEQQKVARETTSNPPAPNVELTLLNPKEPVILLRNVTDRPAREVIYAVLLWNLSNLTKDPLPIPSAKADFVRAHSGAGPYNLFTPVINVLKEGNKLFGFATVTCPDCLGVNSYWVYLIWGKDGWVSEIHGQGINLIKLYDAIPTIASAPEITIDMIVKGDRVPIAEVPR